MSAIAQIKARVPIADLVADSFTLTGSGRIRSTVEHDSLKLWTDQGRWYWFSQAKGGDVLDWFQHIHHCDLATAMRRLADRAGLELKPLSPHETREREQARQAGAVLALAAAHYHAQLLSPGGRPARDYCESRGWTSDTLTREGLGYSGDPRNPTGERPLASQLRDAGLLDHPMAKAVLSLPHGMLVYVHRDCGRPIYLSARSLEGKRHFNLPTDSAGDKQPYANSPVTPPTPGVHLLVEGQADAIALGQSGIHATALCGLTAPALQTGITHIAMDADRAGRRRAIDLAVSAGPFMRVVVWPPSAHSGQPVKDAADLVRAGDDVTPFIDDAPLGLLLLAQDARSEPDPEKRKARIVQFFSVFEQLDDVIAADLKPQMAAALCGSISQFNRLAKAHKAAEEEGGEKPAHERFRYSAGGSQGSLLWEQCVVDSETGGLVFYAIRQPDGRIEMGKSVEIGDTAYLPFPASMDIIQKKIVLFPERPEEYGDQLSLLRDVQAFIHRYLDVDPFYERLAAYYVLFSWLYDLFQNLPYLRALGDYGTGKTRFLLTIGAICYRPMFASGASTVSPMFRVIDLFNGTLIVDEADLANSDAENELIKIFNVGYYKGGAVLRSEKDPNSKYDEYWPSAKLVYGPKLLATRKPFTDKATESRCLTKRMTTARPRPGIPFTLEVQFWLEAQSLRNKLLLYRLRNHRPVSIDQAMADQAIEPRLNQITLALKSLISDPKMREEIDHFMRLYNAELINERGMSLEALVLQAIVDLFYAAGNLYNELDLTMQTIAAKALEYAQAFDPDIRVPARRVGEIVRRDFNLTTRQVTTGTLKGRHQVVCSQEQLVHLMTRYGISPPAR